MEVGGVFEFVLSCESPRRPAGENKREILGPPTPSGTHPSRPHPSGALSKSGPKSVEPKSVF